MEYVAIFIAFVIFGMINVPKAQIALLDNNKTKNEIAITFHNQTMIIDEANSISELSDTISKPKKISKADLEDKFGKVATKEVLMPVSLLFYFQQGSNELTPQSKQDLNKINYEIIKRKPCTISVIGHSDTKGDDKINFQISLLRAQTIKEWIEKQDLLCEKIEVKSHGKRDLAIQTKDNVSEPLNRRVEVLIK